MGINSATSNLRKKMKTLRPYVPVSLLIVLINCSRSREVLASLETTSLCIGDQLTLTCSTNGTSLQWSVTHPRIVVIGVGDQPILSTGRERRETFVTSLGVFTFYRTSISPLMSVLEIDNITADLNDTRVDCAHAEGMSTTAITVIQSAISNLSIIETKEGCDTKNISLLLELEWTKEDVMYNVTVLPTPPSMSTDNYQIRLTVFYNMFYNVTVTTLCGQKTKVIHYAKCDDPLLNLSSDVMVSGYTDPALEGTNITIICPTVTGSNTTLVISCMEDGLWEPDPIKTWPECADLATGSHTSPSTDATSCCDMYSGVNKITFTTEVLSKDKQSSDSATLIIATTTVIMIILLTALIIIIIGIVIFKRNKGKLFPHIANSGIMLDEPQGPVEPPGQQSSLNEYSLVQPHSLQEQTNNSVQFHQPHQPQTLVYADLGPAGSFQRQKNIVVETYKLDDDRVEYAQVLTSKLSTRKEELQPVTVDHSCADESLNLDSLLIQIKPEVTPNWYKFGEAIGVDDKVLDRCVPYPPEESIVEVCDHWLRNHSGKPTWREVAEALGQINFEQLAFDIEKVYETGMFPKKVNMNDNDDLFEDAVPPPIPPKLLL